MDSESLLAAAAPDRETSVGSSIQAALIEPRIGSPHKFTTTGGAIPRPDKSYPSAKSLDERVTADMTDGAIPELTIEQLLIEFLRRVEKVDNHSASNLTNATILDRVKDAIKEPCKDNVLQQALDNYVNCTGKTERDVYEPLVKLCNQVLETVRATDAAIALDKVLRPEDQSHPIQFVRYDNLPMTYDWLLKNGAPRALTLKPDILIARKSDIEYYEASQTKPNKPFDPSARPTPTKYSRMKIKHVLGCIEVKWKGGHLEDGDTQSQAVQGSESSQNLASSASALYKRKTPSSKLPLPSNSKSRKTSSQSHASSGMLNAHAAQLGRYASELLSRGPYVTHSIGLKIKNEIVEICWYDRQTTISSAPLDITANFESFVILIIALSRFSLLDWGIIKELYPDGNDQISYSLSGGRTLRVDMKAKPVCHRISLHSRGTMVLRGELNDQGETTSVVVKVSYPEVRRIPEGIFISEGRKTKLKNHFPLIYHTEDFGPPTSDIRQRLGRGKGLDRIRRIIVLEPLSDITSLTDSKQVSRVWLDCLKAHHEMWTAGYEHGDISIYNLMYRKGLGTESDNVIGVLNDWDLATSRFVQQGVTPERGKRTGTVPFASIELITGSSDPYTRRYRHDLESFGWCLVYICILQRENFKFLDLWHDSTSTVGERSAFFSRTRKYTPRTGFERLLASARALIHWLMYTLLDTPNRTEEPWPEPEDSEVWEGVLKVVKKDFDQEL